MSGPEEARLRRAVRRLMEGQREALGIVRATLEAGDDARTDDALAELDRLGISIFHRPQGRGLGQTISVGVGRERAYPELLRAIEERTPELLRVARFEPSRHTSATYVRRPGGEA